MSTHNSREGIEEFEKKLYQDITDVGGFAMAKAVKTWHHQELQKVRAERDTYWKERVEELELSCLDDRLLGKTDEYLEGYNTSTQRWREQRDILLDNLK